MSINPLSSLVDAGIALASRIWPDPIKQAEEIRKLRQLEVDKDLAGLQAEVSLLIGQIEINKAEAQHSSIFVAGWRPWVGWVGGFAFAYVAILEPLMRFVAKVMFSYSGEFPEIDTTITMQVLFGLLGLGAFRSWDKEKSKTKTKVDD